MKIIDGIYGYIWKSMFENNCNMYYFGGGVNILFDPGLKNYMDVRQRDLEKDGIDMSGINYVVNTHGHPDHFEGSMHFMDKNIPVAMYKEEIEFVNQEGPMFFEMMGMAVPKLEFKKILEEGKWKVGNTELEVFHTPGHSPGSICVYWPEKKALVCGDLIFQASVGRVDFPGGSGDLLKKSIKRISELDIELLLPGHMGFIKGKKEVERNFQIIINQYFAYM